MQLIFILALLPFIYVLAWLASPLLYAAYSVVVVAEKVHNQFGPLAEFAFFDIFIVLGIFCGWSTRFFWFGLLPLVVACCVIARP
jgi:hypothetical protein